MQIYYISMILLLISGIYLCEYTNKASLRNIYFIFSGILLTAIASFRYAIGFDYYSYRSIYEATAMLHFSELFSISGKEILFTLVNKLFSMTGLSYTFFLLFINLFLHGVILWFIRRYSKFPWLSFFLFIAFQFLAHNMNLLRQSISAAFFLLAFPSLEQKKFFPFLLLLTIGGLFHHSTFYIIPLYFLLHLDFRPLYLFTISILAGLLYFFWKPIFQCLLYLMPSRYSRYTSSIYWQGNSFRYIILPICYFLLILFFSKALRNKNPKTSLLLNSAFYTMIINIFITKHFILERFSVYPFYLSLILIPEIVDLYWQERRIKKWYILSLFLLFGLIYFQFAVSEGFHNVYPYISLFDRAASNTRQP